MLDKNGLRIQAGDIVRITGAYFKNDNACYFVEQDGTNPGYLADDTEVTLTRIGKSGKISTAKYKTAFFPLRSYTSDRAKNAAADEWNRKHAAIEIIHSISNEQVIEHFRKEAEDRRAQEQYYSMRGYDWEHWVKQYAETAVWYESVVERMTGEYLTMDKFVTAFC